MKALFARKEKNLAVGLIALSVFSMMRASVQVAYTQQGQEQVASDGGLTATLNGDTFREGDEIVISGTVSDREVGSNAFIEVIDPESQRVEFGSPSITADNTFVHRFVAGEERPFSISEPMETLGNYRIEVRYTTPDRDREAVEFVFAYVGDEEIEIEESEDVEVGEAIESAAVINITAINQTAATALEVMQLLNESLTNDEGDIALTAEDIRLYINTTQNLLLDIQGNLTSAFSVPPEEVQVVVAAEVTNGDESNNVEE
jgi:hypothetical protein